MSYVEQTPMWDSIIVTTFQAIFMSIMSSCVAQVLIAYQENTLSAVDFASMLRFAVYAALSTPPNYLLQLFMESKFPGVAQDEEQREGQVRSWGYFGILRNLAIKLAFDQTLGAAMNTLLFIAAMGVLRRSSWIEVTAAIKTNFWPMLSNGGKFWTFVSIVNFSLVPVERRILVGSIFGLFWGVYTNLLSL